MTSTIIEMQQSLDKARRMEQKVETLYFEGKTSEETLQIAREKVNQLEGQIALA